LLPVPDRRTKLLLLLVGLVVFGALGYGAWTGFPVLNDAYMVGFVREQGRDSLLRDHPDQPFYGLLLQACTLAFGWARAPYVVIGLLSWILLAWQASRLWRRLYPEDSRLWPLAALLVVSPILVETQYTTVTAVFRANLPVSLCLAALLICLRSDNEERRSLLPAASLVLVAGSMTEYGLGTMVACATLLLFLRRFRSAGALAAGGAVGYGIFRLTADVGTVIYVDPSRLLPSVFRNPFTALGRWLSGIWHSLAGAWLSAPGDLTVDLLGRSTLVATAAGLGAAWVIVRVIRGPAKDAGSEKPPGRLASLCLTVAAGLIPVVLANRAANLPLSDSRHRTHVLVFAALAFLAAVGRIVTARYRMVAYGLLAYATVSLIVLGAFRTRRHQLQFEEIGSKLRPLVQGSSGITVAVLPGEVLRTDLTQKATVHWTDEESSRAWILIPDKAVKLFGPRSECRATDRIDTPPFLHSTGRHGAVSHLVWVSMAGDEVEALEDYCVDPVSSADSATPAP